MSDNVYKAKREYNGDWVFGNLFQNFRKVKSVNIVDFNSNNWYEVDPKTVCQATKLRDRNNKIIFDNDRLRVHVFYEGLGDNLGVVEKELKFECVISIEEMGLWLHCDTEEMSGYILHFNYQFHEESFEVIGNIHD